MTNRFCAECNHPLCPNCIDLKNEGIICCQCKKQCQWAYVPEPKAAMPDPGTVEWLNETYAKQIAEIKAPLLAEIKVRDNQIKLLLKSNDVFVLKIADLEAKLAAARDELEQMTRLWKLRGEALKKPCPNCGYRLAIIKAL